LAGNIHTEPAVRALMQAGFALLAVGRSYAMPPGVPVDRLAAMRQAFADTRHDPSVVEEGNRLGLRADRGQTADRLNGVIATHCRSPAAAQNEATTCAFSGR
jgi:hypothetical protein